MYSAAIVQPGVLGPGRGNPFMLRVPQREYQSMMITHIAD